MSEPNSELPRRQFLARAALALAAGATIPSALGAEPGVIPDGEMPLMVSEPGHSANRATMRR